MSGFSGAKTHAQAPVAASPAAAISQGAGGGSGSLGYSFPGMFSASQLPGGGGGGVSSSASAPMPSAGGPVHYGSGPALVSGAHYSSGGVARSSAGAPSPYAGYSIGSGSQYSASWNTSPPGGAPAAASDSASAAAAAYHPYGSSHAQAPASRTASATATASSGAAAAGLGPLPAAPPALVTQASGSGAAAVGADGQQTLTLFDVSPVAFQAAAIGACAVPRAYSPFVLNFRPLICVRSGGAVAHALRERARRRDAALAVYHADARSAHALWYSVFFRFAVALVWCSSLCACAPSLSNGHRVSRCREPAR